MILSIRRKNVKSNELRKAKSKVRYKIVFKDKFSRTEPCWDFRFAKIKKLGRAE